MEREFEHPEIESMEPENEKWEFGKFISNSFISCLNVYTVYIDGNNLQPEARRQR